MSDTFRAAQDATAPAQAPVREAYSFACMNCGHGWEQSYEILHRTGTDGRVRVVYHAAGEPVPSPLTRPSCGECGGHLVRIMRSGRVASAAGPRPGRPAPAARVPARRAAPAGPRPARTPWLTGLLALLHRKPHEGPRRPRAV